MLTDARPKQLMDVGRPGTATAPTAGTLSSLTDDDRALLEGPLFVPPARAAASSGKTPEKSVKASPAAAAADTTVASAADENGLTAEQMALLGGPAQAET